MKRLIVSADDFGIAKSVNEGIARAFAEGIVTNINIIPAGEAFDDAVKIARDIKLAEAGAHLSLTEVVPVLNPSGIQTLVLKDGRFRKHYWNFFADMMLNKIDLKQVYAELKAQTERIFNTGIRVTSLSSHEHIHMTQPLLEIFIKIAREYKIPFVRCIQKETMLPPITPLKTGKNIVASVLSVRAKRMLDEAGVGYAGNFMGLLDSGLMDEQRLFKVMGFIKDGVTELVVHPGFVGPEVVDRYRFHLNCEAELAGLTAKKVRLAVAEHDVKLLKYSEL